MFVDDNGIIRFEDEDEVAPLQTALNTALQSVSMAFSDHTHNEITDGSSTLQILGATATVHNPEGNAFLDLQPSSDSNYGTIRLRHSEGTASQVYFPTSGNIELNAGGNAGNSVSSAVTVLPDGALPLTFRRKGTSTRIPVAAIATGITNVTGTGAAFASTTVTLPGNRFTVTPHATASSQNSNYIAYVVPSGTSSNSIQVGLRSSQNTNWSSTIGVFWIAVQV